jgi:hypothetical protein
MAIEASPPECKPMPEENTDLERVCCCRMKIMIASFNLSEFTAKVILVGCLVKIRDFLKNLLN